MGRAARASDNHLKSLIFCALGELDKPVWRPVGGNDPVVVRHPESIQGLGGVAHGRPVGLASHDNGDGCAQSSLPGLAAPFARRARRYARNCLRPVNLSATGVSYFVGMADPSVFPSESADRDLLLAQIASLKAELAAARARIENAEALAHEDQLTGALNRRGFARELERAWSFCRRYQTPVSLMLFDVDGLKVTNDRYGHTAGDLLIAGVAKTLRRHLRVSDTVARLGGDEFGVLVWHADEAAAIVKAKSLQQMLDASSVPWANFGLPLCASVGVAEFRPEGGADAALTLADKRLYADKAARRDPRQAA